MDHRIRVRLTEDLTRYHPQLIPGVEGFTVGRYGLWSRGSDRFIGVHFPQVGTFDILWEGLEIIDKEYLADLAEREKRRLDDLKNAKNVVRTVGPKGGFKYITYEYVDENGITNYMSNGNRQEAEKLIDVFRKHGIKIKEQVLQKGR